MLINLDSQLQKRLHMNQEEISKFCQRWNIRELYVFGSILTDRFHNNSDIDLLLSFSPNSAQGLLTLAKIKNELEAKTLRQIDIVLKESIENSENWLRRQEILQTMQLIYAKR